MIFKKIKITAPQFLFILFLLASLELLLSGIFTLLIPSNAEKVLVLGLSIMRCLLILGIWLLSMGAQLIGIFCFRRGLSISSPFLAIKELVFFYHGSNTLKPCFTWERVRSFLSPGQAWQ